MCKNYILTKSIMEKKIVTFGEIMLRLATPDYLRFNQSDKLNATFGGGEANVAVSLANYGLKASFVTRLPQNDIARACVMDLRKYGVDTSDIIYGGERLGRSYMTVLILLFQRLSRAWLIGMRF